MVPRRTKIVPRLYCLNMLGMSAEYFSVCVIVNIITNETSCTEGRIIAPPGQFAYIPSQDIIQCIVIGRGVALFTGSTNDMITLYLAT